MESSFNPESKFEGKLGDSSDVASASYNETCADLELDNEQKYKFFHNLFKGEAKRFYREQVATVTVKFGESEGLMRDGYN